MFRPSLSITLALLSAPAALACPDKPIPQEALAPQVVDMVVASAITSRPMPTPPVRAADPALDIPAVGNEHVVEPSPAPTPTQFAQIETASPKAPDMAKSKTPSAQYEAVLKSRISPGAEGLMVFDYKGAKAAGDLDVIAAYVNYLEAQNPDTMSENEAIAFWANLYNAVTLEVVLENYPVNSIKKIGGGIFGGGPWKKDIISVNGRAMSLDNVEHDTLRKKYPSPYIHYMVNCASVGCPNLPSELWRADTLQAKRKEAARAYINSQRGVQIKGSKLTVSSIYKWFEEDFGGSKAGVLAHLREHADADLAAAIDGGAKIAGYDYDWTLNE